MKKNIYYYRYKQIQNELELNIQFSEIEEYLKLIINKSKKILKKLKKKDYIGHKYELLNTLEDINMKINNIMKQYNI